MARLRIDGLPIDHLQGSSASGPLAWITSGKLDGVVDITFPRHPSEDVTVSSVLSEIIGNVAEIASPAPPSPPADPVTEQRRSKRDTINPGTRPLGKPALVAPEEEAAFFTGNHSGVEEEEREVVMDIDLRFRDLKAAVPFRTEELSYVNSALIRPIVAFIKFVSPLSAGPSLFIVLTSSSFTAPTGPSCRSDAASSSLSPNSTVLGRFVPCPPSPSSHVTSLTSN